LTDGRQSKYAFDCALNCASEVIIKGIGKVRWLFTKALNLKYIEYEGVDFSLDDFIFKIAKKGNSVSKNRYANKTRLILFDKSDY